MENFPPNAREDVYRVQWGVVVISLEFKAHSRNTHSSLLAPPTLQVHSHSNLLPRRAIIRSP